jgi:hypothetical protein
MTIEDITELLKQNTVDTLTIAKNIEAPYPLYEVQNGWSGIQILEHLLLTDKLIMTLIFCEPQGLADHQFLVGEKVLRKSMVEEPGNIEAPRPIHPTGSIETIAQFIEEYSTMRTDMEARIKNSSHLPPNRYYKNRIFGNMTYSDWLLFIIYHTVRHHNQIKKLNQNEHKG